METTTIEATGLRCRYGDFEAVRGVDLALATMGDPDILFLDEPTTGLDPESRHRTWDVVRELLVGGTTVLLTTHYLEEAEALADRLAIMHEGTVAVTGTVTEVVAEQPTRISFDHPDAAPPLPVLSGGRTEHRPGEPVRIRTGALQRDLATVLAWAAEHDIELHRLTARNASLDDVFRAVRSAQPQELTEVAA
ncbi:MAG: hypothetical protein M3Q39_01300 [Actinomycetota bacterium]|nr:hypothetical protein [Actinomycetota bacterium]